MTITPSEAAATARAPSLGRSRRKMPFRSTYRGARDAYSATAAGLPAEFSLTFGSCYAYSPRGRTEVCGQSRLLCSRVKAANPHWLRKYAWRVRDQALREQRFAGFFSADVLLVPVPPSDCTVRIANWPTRHLACAFRSTGLGGPVWVGLRRARSVSRSSAAWAWERPGVIEHVDSFAIERPAADPSRVLLVDDVVTRGRTLAAAAILLRRSFPSAEIRAFALVRTLGLVTQITRLLEPCLGEIRWNGKDADRIP